VPIWVVVLESYVLIMVLVFSLGIALDVNMRNLVEMLTVVHIPVLIAAGVAHFGLHVI
jgi:hypothetical protein